MGGERLVQPRPARALHGVGVQGAALQGAPLAGQLPRRGGAADDGAATQQVPALDCRAAATMLLTGSHL